MAEEAFELRPARRDETEFAFALLRDGLKVYVEAAWGWDEAAQRRHVHAEVRAGRYEIVEQQGRAIGVIATSAHPDHLYLHYIALVSERRRVGLGTALMRLLLARAAALGVPLRLSVFRANPARRLYLRLGFRVTTRDEHREWMEVP